MSFADSITDGLILEGSIPAEITLAESCNKGDALGIFICLEEGPCHSEERGAGEVRGCQYGRAGDKTQAVIMGNRATE